MASQFEGAEWVEEHPKLITRATCRPAPIYRSLAASALKSQFEAKSRDHYDPKEVLLIGSSDDADDGREDENEAIPRPP